MPGIAARTRLISSADGNRLAVFLKDPGLDYIAVPSSASVPSDLKDDLIDWPRDGESLIEVAWEEPVEYGLRARFILMNWAGFMLSSRLK
mmetsp:Transcript_52803/g.120360  ORF Transcript_52803/g.120360 Transcript_52803/m.120360 type:complete len:90 (+) Transcript_52803:290-559(+)